MTSTSTDRIRGARSSLAIKAPCVACTTANITLSGEQTIDGKACVTGDRVIVKNQTSGVNNGIYVVDTGDWNRAPDFDGTDDVVTGSMAYVVNGTTNGNKFFQVTTTGTILPGTTSITFASVSIAFGTPAANSITYGQIQQVAANSVLCNPTAGVANVTDSIALTVSQLFGRGSTGNLAAINLGTGLAMSGTTLGVTGQTVLVNGQCQLQYVSTISIKLVPWNGNLLVVNGVSCTVPDAGVSVANTGLTASTKYYVYAVATAGVISSIECSATAYAVSTTAGNKGTVIKSGDDSRTLVGMVYMNTGTPGTFGNSAVWQGVRSWFNDQGLAASSGIAANKTTTSTTYVKLDSTTDITILTWANEVAQFGACGSTTGSVAGTVAYTGIGVDGLSAEDGQCQFYQSASGITNQSMALTTSPRNTLSEGAHVISLLGAVNSGTGTWDGAAAPSSTPTLRSTFWARTNGVNP